MNSAVGWSGAAQPFGLMWQLYFLPIKTYSTSTCSASGMLELTEIWAWPVINT